MHPLNEHFETDEARQLREHYNSLAKEREGYHSSRSVDSHSQQLESEWVEMPCIAGSVLVLVPGRRAQEIAEVEESRSNSLRPKARSAVADLLDTLDTFSTG